MGRICSSALKLNTKSRESNPAFLFCVTRGKFASLQELYTFWVDCFATAHNLPQKLFRSPSDKKKRAHVSAPFLFVRPGVIETPTDPWQGPVIPLNHGRILTFVALLSLTQSTD